MPRLTALLLPLFHALPLAAPRNHRWTLLLICGKQDVHAARPRLRQPGSGGPRRRAEWPPGLYAGRRFSARHPGSGARGRRASLTASCQYRQGRTTGSDTGELTRNPAGDSCWDRGGHPGPTGSDGAWLDEEQGEPAAAGAGGNIQFPYSALYTSPPLATGVPPVVQKITRQIISAGGSPRGAAFLHAAALHT